MKKSSEMRQYCAIFRTKTVTLLYFHSQFKALAGKEFSHHFGVVVHN